MKTFLSANNCNGSNPARSLMQLDRQRRDRFISQRNSASNWIDEFDGGKELQQVNQQDFGTFDAIFEEHAVVPRFDVHEFDRFQHNPAVNINFDDKLFDEAFNQAQVSIGSIDKGKEKMKDNWEQQFEEAMQHLTVEPTLDQFDQTWNQKVAEYSNVQVPGEFANSWEEEFDEFTPNVDMNENINPFSRQVPDKEYVFEQNNPYLMHPDPFAEGMRLLSSGGSLSATALAFESAVQESLKNEEMSNLRAERWALLGRVQAENEKEEPAIAALQNAVKLDPNHLDALMGLSVSYTNEGYDQQAYLILDQWIAAKYPSLHSKLTTPSADLPVYEIHDRVRDLLLDAVRQGGVDGVDADVQIALGVVFYNSGQYDKAVDCFNTALTINPKDYLLWNRLGATLANSGKSEEAIGAYHRALEIKPTFVRGLYNLGVSCMNIGCYKEAAEHFLGALSLHQVQIDNPTVSETVLNDTVNISHNLWETLRRNFGLMERRDLADLCVPGGNINLFRSDFQF